MNPTCYFRKSGQAFNADPLLETWNRHPQASPFHRGSNGLDIEWNGNLYGGNFNSSDCLSLDDSNLEVDWLIGQLLEQAYPGDVVITCQAFNFAYPMSLLTSMDHLDAIMHANTIHEDIHALWRDSEMTIHLGNHTGTV
jgi:hypothetical protein